LDALTLLAAARGQDQLAVGMLDEGPEQGPLDFEASLMDVGLDGVGKPRILGRQVGGHLELEPDGDGLILLLRECQKIT
jgi:hypothetical protein